MIRLYLSVLAAVLSVFLSGVASAADSMDCESVKNDRERLECYDQRIIVKPAIPGESNDDVVDSPLRDRIDREETLSNIGDFVIVPHRPTYFMPVTYVDGINTDPWLSFSATNESIENWEAKYQISFKVPIWRDIADKKISLWFGYTQLSLWQLYNAKASSPFRETNYEPELVLAFETNNKIFGMNNNFYFVWA